MRYVGLGRWMKSDVCFEDILTICDLIREADGTPFFNRVRHYSRVVGIMTTGTGFLVQNFAGGTTGLCSEY